MSMIPNSSSNSTGEMRANSIIACDLWPNRFGLRGFSRVRARAGKVRRVRSAEAPGLNQSLSVGIVPLG